MVDSRGREAQRRAVPEIAFYTAALTIGGKYSPDHLRGGSSQAVPTLISLRLSPSVFWLDNCTEEQREEAFLRGGLDLACPFDKGRL